MAYIVSHFYYIILFGIIFFKNKNGPSHILTLNEVDFDNFHLCDK